MTNAEDLAFLESLRNEFIDIALGQMDDCEQFLLAFEEQNDPAKILEFKRQLHSLKGSSRATDMEELANAIHDVETKLELSSQANKLVLFLDLGFKVVDQIRAYLNAFKNKEDPEPIIKSLRAAITAFTP